MVLLFYRARGTMSFISKITGVVHDLRNKTPIKPDIASPKATVTQPFMHDLIQPHDAYDLTNEHLQEINEQFQDSLFDDSNNQNSEKKLFFIA